MSPENGVEVAQTHWGESEIRGPVHLFRERLLLRLFRDLLPKGKVLDAGCGSGSMSLDLCAAGYQVEAVALALRFDELFARWSWGRGIVIAARRLD